MHLSSKLTSPNRLWSGGAFVQRRGAASDPPSGSQCNKTSGDSLMSCGNYKTCARVLATILPCAAAAAFPPPETLNKGQLQTCCKLWLRAFGSSQLTQVVSNTFRANGLVKYCHLSRLWWRGTVTQGDQCHCAREGHFYMIY